jgi:hypothetical protein
MSVIAVSATITKLPAVKRFIGAGPWPAPPTPVPAPGAVGGPLATRIGDPSLPPPLPQPATEAATSIITSHISGLNNFPDLLICSCSFCARDTGRHRSEGMHCTGGCLRAAPGICHLRLMETIPIGRKTFCSVAHITRRKKASSNRDTYLFCIPIRGYVRQRTHEVWKSASDPADIPGGALNLKSHHEA